MLFADLEPEAYATDGESLYRVVRILVGGSVLSPRESVVLEDAKTGKTLELGGDKVRGKSWRVVVPAAPREPVAA
jgi:hypothetical protein